MERGGGGGSGQLTHSRGPDHRGARALNICLHHGHRVSSGLGNGCSEPRTAKNPEDDETL